MGSLVDLFLSKLFRHHGLPTDLIIGRNPWFTSEFFHSLVKHWDVKQEMSTIYNWWRDGQSVRRAWAKCKTELSVTSDVRGRRRGEFSPITEVPNGISSHSKERSQHRFVYFCTLIRSNELTLSNNIPFWSSHVSRIYPWCLPHTTNKTEIPNPFPENTLLAHAG